MACPSRVFRSVCYHSTYAPRRSRPAGLRYRFTGPERKVHHEHRKRYGVLRTRPAQETVPRSHTASCEPKHQLVVRGRTTLPDRIQQACFFSITRPRHDDCSHTRSADSTPPPILPADITSCKSPLPLSPRVSSTSCVFFHDSDALFSWSARRCRPARTAPRCRSRPTSAGLSRGSRFSVIAA